MKKRKMGENDYPEIDEECEDQEIEYSKEQEEKKEFLGSDCSHDDHEQFTEEKEIYDDESKETLEISDGSRKIYLSSSKSDLTELSALMLSLLQEKDVRDLLRLDNNKSVSYLG